MFNSVISTIMLFVSVNIPPIALGFPLVNFNLIVIPEAPEINPS